MAIAEAMEDNYDPQRKKKANKRLEGSSIKTQERNRKKHQSRAHEDAKKRYNQTQRAKDMRNARSRRRKQEAKICLSEMRAAEDKRTSQQEEEEGRGHNRQEE